MQENKELHGLISGIDELIAKLEDSKQSEEHKLGQWVAYKRCQDLILKSHGE